MKLPCRCACGGRAKLLRGRVWTQVVCRKCQQKGDTLATKRDALAQWERLSAPKRRPGGGTKTRKGNR